MVSNNKKNAVIKLKITFKKGCKKGKETRKSVSNLKKG